MTSSGFAYIFCELFYEPPFYKRINRARPQGDSGLARTGDCIYIPGNKEINWTIKNRRRLATTVFGNRKEYFSIKRWGKWEKWGENVWRTSTSHRGVSEWQRISMEMWQCGSLRLVFCVCRLLLSFSMEGLELNKFLRKVDWPFPSTKNNF